MSERSFYVTAGFQGGTVTPIISGAPPRGRFGAHYLKRIEGRISFSITQAGGASIIPGRRLMEMLQNVLLKPKVGIPIINNISGWSIRALQWPLTMRGPIDPLDIPAAAATYTGVLRFLVPFEDWRHVQIPDGGVPMRYITNAENFALNWQGANYFGANSTINAATNLFLKFIFDERFDADVGERVLYEQVGLTTFTNMPVPPGLVTDMLLTSKDGTAGNAISSNSYSSFIFQEDGDFLHQAVPPDELIQAFNHSMISDVLGELPFTTNNTPEFIPLIWSGKRQGAEMMDRSRADQTFNLLVNLGSAPPSSSSLQLVIRRVLPVDIADHAAQVSAADPSVDEGMATLGLQVAARLPADQAQSLIRANTNSKIPLAAHGVKGGVYGRYMRRTANPANLRAAALAASSGGAMPTGVPKK